MHEKLVIITNLYPLPWQPTRATFNYQQFTLLATKMDVYILIPVAFLDWFKNRKQINQRNERIKIVPYIYLPKIGRRFYGTLMYWSLNLLAGKWLKKIAPTKVLASWAFPDGIAAQKIAKQLNAEFYLKVHGSDINMHTNFPARAKQIVTMANKANGILSVSYALANKMIELGVERKKIKVIYNGVDQTLFKMDNEQPPEKKYILYIGNLIKTKGVGELLESFNFVSQQQQNLQLIFVGGGPEQHVLERRSRELNLKTKVTFLGKIPHQQLPALIANAKLTVLPSYNEGVPNVLLESMACGTPIVATNVGGIPEIINDSIGILVEKQDTEALSNAIITGITRDWNKLAISKSAQRFTWSNNINDLVQLLST
jgi:glycosyltransferase involved in cell wall biosynthesis